MADFVREMVSQNKVRYRGDGFNLDLTYITPNIIAMGFPSSHLEAMYRNDVDDVVRFLEERHRGHYLVINLCSEKFYNPGIFGGRVLSFPIDDHGPPPFRMLLPFCRKVDEWLSANPGNVVAVHCRAGRDRTGTMISAYFLYRGMARTAADAIKLFAMQRTYDGKRVIIPSQRRYVKYFEQLLANAHMFPGSLDSTYRPVNLLLTAIVITPPPHRSGFHCDVFYTVQMGGVVRYTSEVYDSGRQKERLLMVPQSPVLCSEDVKVVVYSRSVIRQDEMFRLWFNTYFVPALDSPYQQKILAGGAALKRSSAPRARPICASCQSNQSYFSDGPSGSFVSVVRLSNTGSKDQSRHGGPTGCGCCSGAQARPNSGGQRALTLRKDEMECDEGVGPGNLTVTLYFADMA